MEQYYFSDEELEERIERYYRAISLGGRGVETKRKRVKVCQAILDARRAQNSCESGDNHV